MTTVDEATVGENYLRRTVYDATELFATVLSTPAPEIEPPRFKVYRGLPRHPLGTGLPLRLADVRDCVDGPQPGRAWDVGTVSALTYYTYGFSRRDEGPGAIWPLHRMVASARCLFPTELYLWIPRTRELPAGLHHYDPLHHGLVRLRAGDLRDELSDAVGAGFADCRAVLLVSSLLWKNAFKYHDYAYRLCSQEAGMVVGNCLLVAAALGLRPAVHHRFVDADLAHLLGLDTPDEGVFAVVALRDGDHRSDAAPAGPGRRPGTGRHVPAIRTSFAGMDAFGQDLDPLLAGIAGHSTLDRLDPPAVPPTPPGAADCTEPSAALPAPGGTGHDFDLAAALRARCSGNVLFHPRPQALSAAELGEILHPLLRPHDGDPAPAVHVLVVAVDVDGIERGAYSYCPQHGGLHPLGVGNVIRRLQGAVAVPNLNLCAANAVVYLAADVRAALRVHGDRGYRITMMQAGVVAQRLSVLAAACGLSARIHNGYDAGEVERALGLDRSPLTPLFQLALAHNRPGVQYGLRVVF